MFGKMLRDGFAGYLKANGSPVVVRAGTGTDAESSYETLGMKTQSDFVMTPQVDAFVFPEPLELDAGTILQVKGSDERWRVERIDDSVEDGTFIYRMAIVTPLPAEA